MKTRLIALSATTALVVFNPIVEIRIHEETAPAKGKEPHINGATHVWRPDGERSPLALKPRYLREVSTATAVTLPWPALPINSIVLKQPGRS